MKLYKSDKTKLLRYNFRYIKKKRIFTSHYAKIGF